ncbi:hypothetical protein ACJJTC_005954 [Scirpophaga incertulas]
MTLLTILFISTCLVAVSLQRSIPSDNSYVAAVLEYQRVGTTAGNLENYINYTQQAAAKDADIVVFPELMLNVNDPVDVPMNSLLKEYPVPALHENLYHTVLVSISKAARQHQIYVVINIEESMDCTAPIKENCPEAKRYLFNTNVVFDRSGAVIDRYRKIHLFGEFTRTPALTPDLGVFDTDFGVRFAHFICFDLMFQVPAAQAVGKLRVTDIVFPTMWFSELPYLSAVQIQEAYAFAHNVNFLGSGANNVRFGSAGSGIYSGRAGALASTMPGLPTSTLLVARVPKIPGQVINAVPGPTYDNPKNLDNLPLLTDPSLLSHVTKKLVPGAQWFTLTDKDIKCTFKIDMSEASAENGYKYRAAAFSGVRTFSGMATGGVRACSVFACTGETLDTCGKRFPQYETRTTAAFTELNIIAVVTTPTLDPTVEAKDTVYYPVSLDTSIMPLKSEDFTYSEDTNDNVTVYTMFLDNTNVELYSFSIWGRVFATDGLDADPPLEVTDETSTIPAGTTTIVTDNTTTDDNENDSAFVHIVSKTLLLPVIIVIIFKFL